MRTLPYLLSMVVFAATNLKLRCAVAFYPKENIVAQTTQKSGIFAYGPTLFPIFSPCLASERDHSTENDKPSDSLDEMLKKDADSEGALSSILGGLALCYNALSNLLLYPIFSFLLLVLSLGAILLGGLLIKKIKNEQSISATWIIFTALYFLFYLDLFLVVSQKRQILCLCLELEKDLLLIIVAALIGYVVGKFFSSKSFEERELP